MQKILVTGGAGFIASCLADELLSQGNEVVIVDNLLTGSLNKLPKHDNCSFFKCDVNNYNEIAEIMLLHKFDVVFHYAALVGVKRTLDNPISVLKDIDGIKNILNLCVKTQVKRVFYSSSSEVYGEPVSLPQHEIQTPLNSRLPYAIVKNVGEAYFRSYKQEHDLDYTIYRFFNTYGVKQSEDFVIAKFIRAAKENRDITIYGDGCQTRTFCHISNNLDATINCLNNNLGVNETINLGNDVEYTILELAQEIIEATNSKSTIVHLPALPEGDMTRRQPEITRMKELMNMDFLTLKDGLKKVISK
jgi:UDP-glucose 4-epimerase